MFCAGSARAVFVQDPTLVCYGYVSSRVRVLGRWRVSRIILRRVSKWLARVGEGGIASLRLPWAVMPVLGDGPVGYVRFTLVPFPCQFCTSGSPSVRALVTFSEWNEETFVYGHFAMVVRPRHADFPNAWEILEVTKDKHHF